MYSLKQLVISGRKRRWILMDLETSLPLLYPLSLIVTTVDEAYEPRKNAPSLKNAWANRVLELDKQDYIFLSIYIAKLRPKTDKHDFIFTSSQQSAKPLSYTSVHSIFSKIDQVFTNQYPEYKSPLYSDSLQRLTPHTTRHTWAFLTLQKFCL